MEREKRKPQNKIITIFIILSILSMVLSIFAIKNLRIIRVSGISMKPTIYDEDGLVAVRYPSFTKPKLKHGDIISFRSPFNKNYGFVKRIIGLPGDEIKLEDGKVYLNGEILIENYIEEGIKTRPGPRYTSWIISDGEVFVLGDNRQIGASSDSRSYGCIPISDITYVVFFRIYPYDSQGFLANN